MTTSTKNVKPVRVKKYMAKGLQPGDKLPVRRSRLKKYPKLNEAQQLLVEEHLWIAGRLAHSAKSLTGGCTGCYTRDDLESVALLALLCCSRSIRPFAWLEVQYLRLEHSTRVDSTRTA